MATDCAVVQLAGFGDVVISTCLVRAIRAQLQARITYYVSSACSGAVEHNPDIDHLVVIPANKHQAWSMFSGTVAQAQQRHQRVFAPWPGFIPRDQWVLLNQPCKPNFMWAYARAGQVAGLTLDVPLKIFLHTTDQEKTKASSFLRGLHRTPKTKLVMMEMHGDSSQSCCNPSWTAQIIDTVMDRYRGDAIVLVSAGGQPPPEISGAMAKHRNRVCFMNMFSIREMSILFNHCDAFLGVSSGTSNACSTHSCRKDVAWFETIVDSLWDSSPLGTAGKHFHYGGDLGAYRQLLATKLP